MKRSHVFLMVTGVLLILLLIAFFATRDTSNGKSNGVDSSRPVAVGAEGERGFIADPDEALPPLDILNPPPLPNDQTKWTTQTVSLKGNDYDIAYVKYDPPRTIRNDVPRSEVNQRTPEDWLEASASLYEHAEGEEDFNRIASLHKGRDGFREMIEYYGSVEKYFARREELKKIIGPTKLYGKIKYKNTITLVVGHELLGRGFTQYVGRVLIWHDGKHYNVSKMNFDGKDSFFEHMSASEYGIVTGVKH